MFAWSLLAIILGLFNTVNASCDNCEGPLGPYCCKTSFRGTCCEYPISAEDGFDGRNLSPLGKHILGEKDDEDIKFGGSKDHGDLPTKPSFGWISVPTRVPHRCLDARIPKEFQTKKLYSPIMMFLGILQLMDKKMQQINLKRK